ncbi:MAG: response regulator [Hydrogenophilaceae bacterium]|nr:response regulator [Hydrogenophilaceae bacterium]
MTQVLIVEDEPDIRRFLRLTLAQDGWTVAEAGSVSLALAEAAERRPGLVILDLGLPDADGSEFIRAFRTWSDAPILVLSARSQEADKVDALEAGADDYLVKPFGVAELLARVHALSRRRLPRDMPEQALIRFGETEIDLARRQVSRAGSPVKLTPIEFNLLVYLASHPDRVLTQRQILRAVWGEGHAGDSHYLRIYIGRLRQKLEADRTRPRHLLTETGVGYRMVL